MKTMQRVLSIFAAVAAVVILGAGWVSEPQDHVWNGRAWFRQQVNLDGGVQIAGTNVNATADQINGLHTNLNATAAEINAVADADGRIMTVVATNGAPVTLNATNTVIVLNGIGSTSGYTNTITIATPYPVGVQYLFRVSSTSTNLVQIDDSTTALALGANLLLGATDTAVIYTAATNEAVKVSTSDN